MFAGHFGVAAAVKAKVPEVPLWALMLGTQLLDVAFVPLFLSGAETIETVSEGYGGALIHADYTHSLAGAVVLALAAGLFSGRLWGKRGGYIMGGVVFSHWLLDLLVHRADLAILPGNLGQLPLMGLGVWRFPTASMVIEAALLVIGFVLYTRSVLTGSNGETKPLAILASLLMGALLGLSLISDTVGLG